MTSTAAGWFPDPLDPSRLRYWDGARWTEQLAPLAPATSTPPVAATLPKRARRVPVWAWILIALLALPFVALLSPVFAPVSLVVLITGIVALSKNTRTWLRLRSRSAAITVTAASAVAFLVTGSITASAFARAITAPVAVAEQLPAVDDGAAIHVFNGKSATATDTSATTGQTALALLATLEIKGRAPKTGYDRDRFGQRWLDVDRNGCDTRNDILARDLTDTVESGPCKVVTGTLADPYTGETIAFQRGLDTSALVQIDHVVSLSDAWQKGAQNLTPDQRATFANDPLNLLAVDGHANMQKGDGDAATWLPKNKTFRCGYVARQVSVKATYHLWVTQAEHDAIARVLGDCPGQPALTSDYSAKATSREEVATEPIAFEETAVEDASLPSGQTRITTAGKNGERTRTYRVNLIDGEEVSRELISDEVTAQPITQVTTVGTYVAPPPPPPAPPAQQPSGCDPNYADACVPVASDVDCAGGSGNGPAYFDGVARVVGSDIYGLDRDGDGYACETR
ncbi:G5 domain-containing protein [Microbacterium deminutum]|uniref:G5 domain-containing protein n=1 Tax=Microbacterium deminutum TaxID=344164 RepID=A0ABP5C687_9MICO